MSRPEAISRRNFFRITSRAMIGLGVAVFLGGGADAINNVVVTRRVTNEALKKDPPTPREEVNKQFEAMGLDENRYILDLASPLIGIFIIALGRFIARGKRVIGPILD